LNTFLRLLFAVALAAAALPALAQAGPTAVPGLRLPRNVEPLDYELHLRVNPAEHAFSGSVDIRLRVHEPTDLVWLNAKGLSIGEASASAPGGDAIPATVVPGSDDVIGFTFARVLPAGDVRLSVRFAGALDRQGSVGAFRQDENGHWYALTQLEPMDARRVLPCFDEPDRKATWKLTLTVPAHVRAFANMPVESERASDAGWREVVFQRSPPLPSYLLAFAVGEFEVVDAGRAGVNGTPISIVVPKGRAAEARYAAANTGAILAAAERFFGAPYPFPKLDLVAYPKAFFGSAMENPGLVTYGARYLLARPDEVSPIFEQRFAGITAHEIAHMWFGNYVTMAWWNDLWLNEAFASWLGGKLVMELHPEWPRGRRSLQRTRAIDVDQLPAARALREPVTDADGVRAAFDSITYAKGETVLAMFEEWLGPEKFRDGVRRYMAKHAWSNATADDFFAALAAGDEAIVPAFRGFADRAGVPLVDVALDCRAAPVLTIAQRRFVAVGASAGTSPPWTFPACFDVGDARASRQVCTIVRESKQTVPLPAGACPQWVVANRSGTGYYLPRLSPALYDALPKADRILGGADYDPLLGDLAILARGGAVGYDVALRVAARQARSPDTRVAGRAYALAASVPGALVDASNKDRYAAFLRRDFGDRARTLGWLPRKGDTADVLRLRAHAVALVATRGQDTALARKAQQLAQRWVTHRSTLPPEARRTVLVVAARTSDRDSAKLFDALYEVAAKSKDANEREDAYRALGAFADPALLDRGLAPIAGGDARSRFAVASLEQALADEATRGLALAWLVRNGDAAMAGIPHEMHEMLPYWSRDACTSRERALFVSAFETRLAKAEGAAVRYRAALERIDQCLALRGAQQASFNAAFAR
jgi:alanyl aminopeptidase